jgi:hypothetical protein
VIFSARYTTDYHKAKTHCNAPQCVFLLCVRCDGTFTVRSGVFKRV